MGQGAPEGSRRPQRWICAAKRLAFLTFVARKRIGELLVEAGVLSDERLRAALEVQLQTKQRLGAVLVSRGFVTEEQLVAVLSEALGVPAVELRSVQPEWRAIHMLRVSFCEANDLFPYQVVTEGQRKLLLLAMADPLNNPAIQEVEFTTGLTVSVRLCTLSAVRAALLRYYHRVAPAQALSRGRTQADELMARPAPVRPERPPKRKGSVRVVEDEPLAKEPESDPQVVVGEEILSPDTELPEGEVELLARERELAAARRQKSPGGAASKDLAFLYGQTEGAERLEQKFWALVRILARKGLITKEEFRKELDESSG